MFSKYLSIFAASAAVVFAYTLPTTMCTDKCNPIIHPGLQEAVPKGTKYDITWDPTTQGTVTILLLRGPAENLVTLFPIVEKIPNKGAYTWDVPASLVSDKTHYGLQLINDADGTYQYSTQFGISGGDSASASGSSSSSFASSSASVSASSSASSASSSAFFTAATTSNVTSSIVTSRAAASTGFPSNGTIISANPTISKPSTLATAGATTSEGSAASSSSATAGAPGTVKMSLGGAAVALIAAAAAL